MEAAKIASEELCLNLAKTLETITALSAVSADKEAYVTSGDIENLRAATEKEEEMIADLRKLEKDRDNFAGALSEAIGVFNNNSTLSSLVESIEDHGIREKLTGLKNRLDEAIGTLTARNEKLKELLALQMNYTEYMLNLIYIPRSKSHSYDIQGARQDVSNDFSLFDVHI